MKVSGVSHNSIFCDRTRFTASRNRGFLFDGSGISRLPAALYPHAASVSFVIRAKSNLQFRRMYSHAVDPTTGLYCDQTIVRTGFYPSQHYPAKLRRIKYYDATSQKTFAFLTNIFTLPVLPITNGRRSSLRRHRDR